MAVAAPLGVGAMGPTTVTTAARSVFAVRGNNQSLRDRPCCCARLVSGGGRASCSRPGATRSLHRWPAGVSGLTAASDVGARAPRPPRRTRVCATRWKRYPVGRASRAAGIGTRPVLLWRSVDAPWPPLRASMRPCENVEATRSAAVLRLGFLLRAEARLREHAARTAAAVAATAVNSIAPAARGQGVGRRGGGGAEAVERC
eukprot:TRINITY_DN11584_c0_g1_i1.p3 TRINITY_DN11584_c0_g1~~TRINITY_DN11584_c0_g1_i1.p3  ORF type:complete len:202 (-),score=20.40 TRINITY_DN11584_c0_g1_i1:101-706(-)